MNEIIQFQDKELDLIRRTVANDCNSAEFDQFISICKATGLDPIRRQIYAFVFNKNKPNERRLTPVVAIDGFRALAARTGNYRPDDQPPRLELDESKINEEKNPKGIVSCTVKVFKYAHGDWHPAAATVYWDEFVPLYNDAIPSGKRIWKDKPVVMISKVAEAQALRRAFPDDFSNIYGEEEIDLAEIIDITPSEQAERGAQQKRLEYTGTNSSIIFQSVDNKQERIPLGQYFDYVMAFIGDNKGEPSTILAWRDQNRLFLRDFWALDKEAALELNKQFEAIEEQREAQAPELELEEANAS